MMFFERFFRAISHLVPPSTIIDVKELEQLNPEKIYVENVRSLLRVSHGIAQAICELAVRQGAFRRYVAVECPDGSEAAEAEHDANLPKTVKCYSDEGGFVHEVEVPTSTLRKVTFYRLANG